MAARYTIGATILLGLVGLLTAALLLRAWGEEAGSNSFVLLADAFLNGRLDVPTCFDSDCALYEGRTYVIFPPMPAVLVMPFVAVFGTGFSGFIPISIVLGALAAWMWWRIFSLNAAGRTGSTLLVIAILFATPFYHAVLRSDGVWFFAQAVAFFFVTSAFWMVFRRENAVLAGILIGFAFLSRQFTILYMPFLLVLMMDRNKPLFHIDRETVVLALKLAIGPALAIAIYLAYNHVRFGDVMQTGYAYIFPAQDVEWSNPDANWIELRVREIGLFAREYLLFNLVYMFLAGPHVEFVGRHLTELGSFDNAGYAPLIGAPFLLFVFLAPIDRRWLTAVGICITILAVTLFYHSNGFSQYSMQRYTLDWLPLIFLLIAPTLTRERIGIFALLLIYSLFLTSATLAIAVTTNA